MNKLTLLLLAGFIAAQAAPREETPQPNADPDAYAIYSAIIQNEWVNIPHEPKHLFINDHTVLFHKMCLKPDRESQAIIGSAITNYLEVNQRRQILIPEFFMGKPYELISVDGPSKPFWIESSRVGWIEFSGIGFNNEKTVAVVSVGTTFPHLHSYSGTFAVLFKKDGKWQPLKWKGEHCAWAS